MKTRTRNLIAILITLMCFAPIVVMCWHAILGGTYTESAIGGAFVLILTGMMAMMILSTMRAEE